MWIGGVGALGSGRFGVCILGSLGGPGRFRVL